MTVEYMGGLLKGPHRGRFRGPITARPLVKVTEVNINQSEHDKDRKESETHAADTTVHRHEVFVAVLWSFCGCLCGFTWSVRRFSLRYLVLMLGEWGPLTHPGDCCLRNCPC